MKRILYTFSLIVLIVLIVLQSCDYDFDDLGDGFSFGYVNTPETYNIHYENVGLIHDQKIDEVRWNDKFILVHTASDKWILINKIKVINHQSEDISVKYVTYKSIKNIEFEDSIKI